MKYGRLFLLCLIGGVISYCGGGGGSEDVGISVCEEGVSCKRNSDCNGGVCSNGKCKCKSAGFCVEDKECGAGMCCDTLKNQCYVCIGDAEYLDVHEDIHQDIFAQDVSKDVDLTVDSLPDIGSKDTGGDIVADTGYDAGGPCDNYKCNCGSYCVVVSNKPECKTGCLKTTDCCQGQYCDTNTKTCKVNTVCHSDQECANNPVNKYCDIGDTFECKECVKDIHCDLSKGYFCETVSKTCKKIQDACNGSCDYTRQFCSTKKSPPSCQPKNPDLCKSCSVTMNNCPPPLVCQPIDVTNPFKGGRCGVECYTIEDCFGNPCDTTYRQCVCQ
ncbi:MAG: hypothetical protein N2746_08860 [Deltaproteobacteria bacterium]|nr:hypothetical protein [Deltaproteobacteria bacterium]